MTRLDQLNASLKSEADIILYNHDILGLLAPHGTPVLLGSYMLNTMTWADLDFYLIRDEPDPADFFELGKKMLRVLHPLRLDYHNNLSGHWPQFPRGLYWGVRTSHGLPQQWKIDVWCLGPVLAQKLMDEQAALRDRITPETRQAILRIKSRFCTHPRYHMGFASWDIYTAVLDRGMRTAEDFEEVLREKGIEF
jgi:hypothetical protein